MLGLKHTRGQQGKVARTGGDVEQLLRTKGGKLGNGLSSPTLIDVARQAMVQHVVSGGDVVEHLFHLLAFIAAVAVRFYLFLPIHTNTL